MRVMASKIIKTIKNPSYLMARIRDICTIIRFWFIYVFSLPIRIYLCKKNIWLIREKKTEARDNGYHFYKYIRENHPEINAYYVISRNSSDYYKVQKYGTIIYYNSFKHIIYFLCSKVSISSQPFGAVPDPAGTLYYLSKKLCRKNQIVVFLQHGVTKDEIPHELDYNKTHFDLWCCASERECQYIKQVYGYPENNIKVLGLCRYDNLLLDHDEKKQILVMPTHRMWLHSSDTAKEASTNEKNIFEKTDYYKAYSSLLGNNQLIDYLRENSYTMIFYPHYALQSFIGCFKKFCNDVVKIANRGQYDVQTLLIESKLLITDYSSVFFDFAYMKKPVIFFQFDDEEYHSKHFKKGYFDFYMDGFGNVCKTTDEVIDATLLSVQNQCFMDMKYANRVETFFAYQDNNNCKRTFEEIIGKAMSI